MADTRNILPIMCNPFRFGRHKGSRNAAVTDGTQAETIGAGLVDAPVPSK